jgi:hypothetical protein
MLCVGEDGVRIEVDGVTWGQRDLQRLRDLIAVRLHASGLTHAQIGVVLGITQPRVAQRLNRIPAKAREYYRRGSLV